MRTATFAAFAMLLIATAAHAQQAADDRPAEGQATSTAEAQPAVPPPPGIARLAAPPGVPAGIWLLPLKAAVQIYDCNRLLCGRVVWLERPRTPDGRLVIDRKNPDPASRSRPLCGLTVLWGLQPAAADHWKNGWLYNPDDGTTYRVNGQFQDADTLVVRIYLGVPLFGQTSIWRRVPRLRSEGWC